MRLSSGCFGIFGFLVLIVATALCSITAYNFSREEAVHFWESGIRIESPLEIVDAITNPEDFTVVTNTPEVVIDIPSPTAQATVVVMQPTATPTTDNGLIEPVATVATVAADSTAFVLPTFTPLPPPTATPDYAQAALQQVGPREINILLMGIDERVGYDTERAYRTDTMMVVHVDPVRKTAGVLSFPRDLWVDIPNYSTDRINNANYTGDINAYPGGGVPALAMETISANFGIRVDYYIMVNFTVFETVVDILAPQGVEICVREVIRDPDYPDAGYGFINVEFDPGCQALNGERTLQYARTRATTGGDLDRARRQQEVLEALREHVLSVGGVSNLVTQAGNLWTELSGSYRTNLELDEIVGLAYLMGEVPRDNIRYNVISAGYVDPRQTQDGTRQILIPIHSRIQELIQETFYPELDVSVADLRARAALEDAPIHVYNNTNIAGLATNTREYLISQQIPVVEIANMPNPDNTNTTIYNYGGASNTAMWLAELLNVPPDRVQRRNDGMVARGVVISVGPDIQTLLGGQ